MKKLAIVLSVGLVLGLAISFVIAVAMDKTATPEFCGSCHIMKPMKKSFYISVHGSNNMHGFASTHCTDCHAPHDSLIGYMVFKAVKGAKDGLAEIGLFGKPDFEKNYNNMSKYVYDSGCLECHSGVKNPDTAYKMSKASVYAHKLYWKDKKEHKDVSCVNCHNDSTEQNFAHPELLENLSN